MKKTIVLIGLCLSTLLFTQCAKKSASTASKTIAPSEEASALAKKYSAAQMAEGKVIYTGSCQKCHELFQPADFTIKKWNKILPDMCGKAELNADKAALVHAWVITNAKQG